MITSTQNSEGTTHNSN